MANYTSHASSGVSNLNLFDTLKKSFDLMPEKTQEIVQDYFKNSGITNEVTSEIRSIVPVSNIVNKRYKGQAREHAKYGESLKTLPSKHGFLVTNKKYYQYLVFPNLGIGTSRNNSPKHFVSKGIEKNTSKIEKDLRTKLEKDLKKIID